MNKVAAAAGLVTAGAFAAVSFEGAREQGIRDVQDKSPLDATHGLVGTSIREAICAIEVGAAGAGAALLANHSHAFGPKVNAIVQKAPVQFGLKAIGVTMVGTGLGMLAGSIVGGVQGAVTDADPGAHDDDHETSGHGH